MIGIEGIANVKVLFSKRPDLVVLATDTYKEKNIFMT